MQRIAGWIGGQDPATVRPVKDEVPGGLLDDSALTGFQSSGKPEVVRKGQMAGCRECGNDGIG